MKRPPFKIITKEQYAQDRHLAAKPEDLMLGTDSMLRRAFSISEILAAIGTRVAPIYCVEEKVSISGIEKARTMLEVSFHYVAEDGTAIGNSRRYIDEDGIIVSRWRHNERGYFLPAESWVS